MVATYDPKPLTPDQLRTLSAEVKQAITDLYGDRLDRVVLYGSYARGDYHAESDVDYLVVLRDEVVKSYREILVMSGPLSDISDAHNVLVSVKPTSLFKYLNSELFFYEDVRREGIFV